MRLGQFKDDFAARYLGVIVVVCLASLVLLVVWRLHDFVAVKTLVLPKTPVAIQLSEGFSAIFTVPTLLISGSLALSATLMYIMLRKDVEPVDA